MGVDTGTILATYIDVCQYRTVRDLPLHDVGCGDTCCEPGLSGADADRLAVLLKALADPVRLQLYSRIPAAGAEVCVCDLPDVGVSQPTVSHHLRRLREAGLIDCERRGTWVYYWRVDGGLDPVRELADLLGRPAADPVTA